MIDRIKVLHLTGSPESQFFADLSVLYATGCLASIDSSNRYESLIAYISPDRQWRFPTSLDRKVIASTKAISFDQAMQYLESLHIDVIVPQMFCYDGMTQFRNLSNLSRIPMIGNPASVMEIAANKVLTRNVVAEVGVRVPEANVLQRSNWLGRTIDAEARQSQFQAMTAKLPLIVKPSLADNSVGVSRAVNEADLRVAIDSAFDHCDTVLVEQYIPLGREVRCGIIESHGKLICLPLQEYRMEGENAFMRATSSKLIRDDDGNLDLTSKSNPQSWIVNVDDPATKNVWDAARACHRSLGCRDYSLFDFRIDREGRPWFLEAGLYCSFSPSSILVAMAEAAGVTLNKLFDDLTDQAIQRARRPAEFENTDLTNIDTEVFVNSEASG